MDNQKSETKNDQNYEATRDRPQEATHNQLPATNVDAVEQTKPDSAVAASSSLTPAADAPPSGDLQNVTSSQMQSAQDRPALVFALGTLGYDFGTEARRDSIMQHMNGSDLLDYLAENPSQAAAIIWTLNLDATTIYAIQPRGAFASAAYERLRQFLREQLDEGVERVSIPGIIVGQARLMSGQVVPVIWPELRCMYSWTTVALTENEDVANFLERVYHELRNLGLTSQERAINYAATNAMNAENIFQSALEEGMKLDSIGVEPSPICRPGADCWDVKLIFFNPGKVFEQARKVYRFTVDVSDVCPVMVGKVRSWYVR